MHSPYTIPFNIDHVVWCCIRSFFGKSGIEYTFARVPIAGSDFSPRFYTYDDVPGDEQLSYFNLTEEDFKLKVQ